MVRCKTNYPYSVWLIVVYCQLSIIVVIPMLRTGHRVGNRAMSGRLYTSIHGKWGYNALVGKLSTGPEHRRPNDLLQIKYYYECLQVVLIYVQNACYFLCKYWFAFHSKGPMCMLLVSHNLHTLFLGVEWAGGWVGGYSNSFQIYQQQHETKTEFNGHQCTHMFRV